MSASDLQPLDVIWLFHGTAQGNRKDRMMVCVSPHDGFFLPINTENFHRPCFPLRKTPDHEWLNHDSHVECNVLEYDDFAIEDSIAKHDIVGYLALSHVRDIVAGLTASVAIRKADRETIIATLKAFEAENHDR